MQQLVFLMMGYPGSGKTTASRLVAELTGAVHIWADEERRQQFSAPTHSRAETQALYDQLNTRVLQLLQSSRSVVYDANFNSSRGREHIRRLAQAFGADVLTVWIDTPPQIARERSRAQGSNRVFAVPEAAFRRMARNLQPPHAHEPHIKLDGQHITKSAVATALDPWIHPLAEADGPPAAPAAPPNSTKS